MFEVRGIGRSKLGATSLMPCAPTCVGANLSRTLVQFHETN
jgi:hypothetical protein